MLRFVLVASGVILVSGLVLVGSVVRPCEAMPPGYSPGQISPLATITPISGATSTLASSQAGISFQVSMTTEQEACLIGETIVIHVSAELASSKDIKVDEISILVEAESEDGEKTTVMETAVSGSWAYSDSHRWSSPSEAGTVELTCTAQAKVQQKVVSVNYVAIGRTVIAVPVETWVKKTLRGDAGLELPVFDPVSPISGRVLDTREQPVSGAIVDLSPTLESTTTDSQGNFKFPSYQISGNYELQGGIPRATVTLSVEGVACEPLTGQQIKVPAEEGVSGAKLTLERCFYPAGIDLSEFTFDAFSDWRKASEYSTWQDILGITIEGPVELTKLSLGTHELEPKSFDIDTKKLYLLTKLESGRYLLEVQGMGDGQYDVAAAATVHGQPLEPVHVTAETGMKDRQLFRLVVKSDSLELKHAGRLSWLILAIPIVVGLAAGIVGAYFVTGGRLGDLRKAFAGVRSLGAILTPKRKPKKKTEEKGKRTARKEAKEKTNQAEDKKKKTQEEATAKAREKRSRKATSNDETKAKQ